MSRKRMENLKMRDETQERYDDGLEASELAKEDYFEGKETVDEVQGLELDDDVREAAERVSEGLQQEAESFMRGEVGETMQEGTELSRETEEHANENAELGHEAADHFVDVQQNRFGAKGELGRAAATESAEFFEDAAQEVSDLRAEKMERYESDLAEIAD